MGRHQEGIALRQRVLQTYQARFGSDAPETLNCLLGLTHAYGMAGQWEQSIPLLKQLQDKYRATLGPAHPRTVGATHNLALAYGRSKRFAASLATHEQALEGFRAMANPEAPIWCLMTYAQDCQEAGEFDRAEQLLREAVALTGSDKTHSA